ncbi:hypothetical protein DFH08DRAFT_1081185 [Mycena albidolilacea]|uniref:Uncharacterized protein n=1 Tax=Mycena albidolilacea TaxID=1033008 RepID=A0AAD6ZXQ7_9AGAR|nr:hypothetical protein DFH08DRAFT_1081185 [Mycena albidolilacea]
MDSADGLLPVELERSIFELAAFLHPECALALMMVAQRAQIWIKPFLFRTLTVDVRTPRPGFRRLSLGAAGNLVDSEPLALRQHTRHLCFVDLHHTDSPRSVVEGLLSTCGSTVDLTFISTTDRFWVPDRDVLQTLPLQRLSFCYESIYPVGHSIFRNANRSIYPLVTHFDLHNCNSSHFMTWKVLAQMPRLTHFSTPNVKSARASEFGQVLRVCKRLEVLVLRYGVQENLDKDQTYAQAIDDPRFVMLVVPDRVVDWEAGRRGGEDYWARASAIVEKRRSTVDGK